MAKAKALGTRKRKELEALFLEHGVSDFKWIDPKDIVVSRWVRMKCTFGCGEYGHNATCPPNTPSVAECDRFFKEYSEAAVLHFPKKVKKPEDRHAWARGVNLKLSKLERDVFLSGFEKSFMLFMDSCSLCSAIISKKGALSSEPIRFEMG